MNYETKMQQIGQVMDKLAERGFECSEGVTSFYNMVGAREIEIDFNTQNYSPKLIL